MVKMKLMKKINILLISVLGLLLLYSCSDNEEVTKKENQAPTKAILIEPANGAEEVIVNPTFKWEESVDPEKKPVAYELYLSTDKDFKEGATKKAIDIHQTQFTFTNYSLERLTKYYWKVVAYDEEKKTSVSKVFDFTSIAVDLTVNLLTPLDKTKLTSSKTEITWEVKRNSLYKDKVTYEVFLKNGSPEFSFPSKKGLKETKTTLENLRGNGTYYWAVAAVDDRGVKVAQSRTFSFTTPNTIPTAAVLYGNVIEEIASNKINAQFKWKASTDPDRIMDNGTLRPEKLTYDFYLSKSETFTEDDIKERDISSQKYTATGLEFDTKYWAKVITKDENKGVVESNIISFTTKKEPVTDDLNIEKGTWTDTRDGKVYKTVTINGKTWLAENYAYIPYIEKDNNGQKMVCSVYGIETPTSIEELKNSENYKKFGVLYSGYSIATIAPKGWHVATDEDWKELESLSGMTDVEVKGTGYRNRGKMQHKFIKKTESFTPNKGVAPTDEIQTSIIYGGYFSSSWKGDEFKGMNAYTYFWTSTVYSKWGTKGLYCRAFSASRKAVERSSKGGKYRMYIRLVKD